jgi:hypothetical protein
MASEKIDVLGLMDRIADFMRDGNAVEGEAVAREAREIVANLIKASREMMRQDAVRNATFNANPFMADAADNLSAALACIGGGV